MNGGKFRIFRVEVRYVALSTVLVTSKPIVLLSAYLASRKEWVWEKPGKGGRGDRPSIYMFHDLFFMDARALLGPIR